MVRRWAKRKEKRERGREREGREKNVEEMLGNYQVFFLRFSLAF